MRKLEVTWSRPEEIRKELTTSPHNKLAIKLLAVYFVACGATAEDVASDLPVVSASAVRNWVHEYNRQGAAGLEDTPPPGRPGRLGQAEYDELKRIILETTPGEHGFDTGTWSGPVLIALVKARWGVGFKKANIYRIMRNKLGLSYLKGKGFYPEADPEVRALTVGEIKKTGGGRKGRR